MLILLILLILINLELLYQQSRYLTPAFRRLVCNALIQSLFDYGSSTWFSFLKKNQKAKLQKDQNKCIHYCLNFPLRSCIVPSHFRKSEQCIENTLFKYWNGVIWDIFTKCLLFHSTDIEKDYRWHQTYLCGKLIPWEKNGSKINPNIINVKTMPSFMRVLKNFRTRNVLELYKENYLCYIGWLFLMVQMGVLNWWECYQADLMQLD